jgi:hypothetical protein
MKLVVSLLLIAASILAQQTQPNQAPSPRKQNRKTCAFSKVRRPMCRPARRCVKPRSPCAESHVLRARCHPLIRPHPMREATFP